MNARENIIQRIRKALGPGTPPPLPAAAGIPFRPVNAWDLRPRFESKFGELKGEFHRAANAAAGREALKRIVAANSFQSIAAANHPDVAAVTEGLPGLRVPKGPDAAGAALAGTDLGITACDSLVAYTGSIVLTSRTGHGRALSILPPAHLVVARISQIVPHLADALARIEKHHGADKPSMISIISGPSRTSDIEKTLVLGAHGPKRLLVLLLDE
ncbi:MAG: lactate utilization protein [Planctomycetota bacterium]